LGFADFFSGVKECMSGSVTLQFCGWVGIYLSWFDGDGGGHPGGGGNGNG